MTIIARTIHFAILPEGLLKVGESCLTDPSKKPSGLLPACIYDALEASAIVRGIGWKFANGLHVPKARRSRDRVAYIKTTTLSVLRAYTLIDLLDSTLCALRVSGTASTSETIFPPSLSLPLTLTALDSAGHSCAAAFYLLSSSLNHFLLLLHPSTPYLFFPIQVRPSLLSCITYKCLRARLRLQVRLEFRQALYIFL